MQMRGKVKWEGMWVIFVECVAYGAALVSPDADFVSIRLTNGMWIEWMRYAGWILTCPVLLMTLVSMTTEDGTKAPTVRLVPLLVANLTMVLLGITAAANLAPVKWYIFAMALSFGGVVFSSAIQCFIALFESSPNGSVRNSSLALALTFLAGWGCFPAAFLTGHSGMDVISVDMQWGLFVIGDILSKNCWVAIAVLRQHQFDLYNAAQELEAQAYAEEEAQETSAPRIKRRASNSHIIIDEVNNNQQSSFTNPTYQQNTFTKQPRARPTPSVTQMQFQQHVHNTPQQQQMVPEPKSGEEADLKVLKGVLARYNNMPPVEREALVPVFAALLGSGDDQQPRSGRSAYPVSPADSDIQRSNSSSRLGREEDGLAFNARARPQHNGEAHITDNAL
jgi:bacteriorhodopsin